MSANHIKNIALVGAGGNVGSAVLNALLATQRFHVTIISHPESKSTFPDGVRVVRGSYDDTSFLAQAFRGADAAIFAMNSFLFKDQHLLIEAAIKAGVEWLIPDEYAADGANAAMVERLALLKYKQDARELIERLGGKYIAVSTGPWTEYNLKTGGFDIDVEKRIVTLISGYGRFNTSTLQQLGKGIAKLLSLPVVNEQDRRRSLARYANSFVYISSLHTTQSELFEAVKRVSGTHDSDWTIKHEQLDVRLADAQKSLASGSMSGFRTILFCNYMGEGLGGDTEVGAAKDREVLGLEEEDIDDVVKRTMSG